MEDNLIAHSTAATVLHHGAAPNIRRFAQNPIIRPNHHPSIGNNVNGPSLIRAPKWLPDRLGKYYLYFAHHDGRFIRMAYADKLEGPWTIYKPGVLPLNRSFFAGHIASPDVHVDHESQSIWLYYHGSDTRTNGGGSQRTRVALSVDGLTFVARPDILGRPYFRMFRWHGFFYALAMPGVVYRSNNGLADFVEGPSLFSAEMRHSAVKLDGSQLTVFYTNRGDCPERILHATLDLKNNWMQWKASAPQPVLEPYFEYEGGHLPALPSSRGIATHPVRQLRDPAIFQEGGQTYLLYAVAGEHGIAIAEITSTEQVPIGPRNR